MGVVEGAEVVHRNRLQRIQRAVVRHAVRMETVDQPVEHQACDVVGVLGAHLESRKRLLPLPLELLRAECRVPHDVAQKLEPESEAVLHHEHIRE
jgi:hypothetical protein